MQSAGYLGRVIVGLVAVVAGTACSTEGEPARSDELGTTDSALVGCQATSAGDPWRNEFFTQRLERFEINLHARPIGGAPIDAVIGMGNGPADTFSDLATIVRFNPDGFIDARDGDTYRSVAPYPYDVDGTHSYWMSIEIKPETSQYSVWVTTDGDTSTSRYVAENFAFRGEQSGLWRFDNLARFVDSANGGLEVCDAYVAWRECLSAFSGRGWASERIEPMSGVFTLEAELAAYPMTTDAVFGLSNGAPDAFADLGPIVRFNPNGTIDARDGSVYRAVETVTRDPNESYIMTMIVDVPAKRYDAWVRPRYAGGSHRIADGFAFRSEQASVSTLDYMGAYVDSESSAYSACDPLLRY